MSELAHYRFHPCPSGPGADVRSGNYDKHVHLAAVPAQTGQSHRGHVCRWIQVWSRVQLRPLLVPPAHLARPDLLNRFFTDALGTRNRLKPNHCGLKTPPQRITPPKRTRTRTVAGGGRLRCGGNRPRLDFDPGFARKFRIHYFFKKAPKTTQNSTIVPKHQNSFVFTDS